MKGWRFLLAVWTAILLLMAPMTGICAAPGRVTFTAGQTAALSGDQATVAVRLENNAGRDMEAMILAVYYDPGKLTLREAAPTPRLPGAIVHENTSGCVLVFWDDGGRKGKVDGEILSLTFALAGGLPVGHGLPIILQCRELFDTSPQMNDIPCETVDGGVTVGDIGPGGPAGDVNGDGVVNARDFSICRALTFAQMDLGMAPGFTLLPPSNQRTAADINGDSLVNVLDLTLLRRMLAGYEMGM